MNYIRAYCQRSEIESQDAGSPIRFTASTEGIKRDGLDLKATDWRFENFRKNPVVLWVHDYTGQNLPIGRATVDMADKVLVADVSFDQEDEFARKVESKYRRGYLHAVSVGWGDVMEGRRTIHDLMDISAVPVPSDPDAIIDPTMRAELESWQRDISNVLQRADYPWDQCISDQLAQYGDMDTAEKVCGMIKAKYGQAYHEDPETTRIEIEQELGIRERFASWDECMAQMMDEYGDEETAAKVCNKVCKQSVQEPVLRLSDVDIWDGIATAMVALYQPESAIEDEARQALYIILERAYRKLGKTAPEFLAREEIASLSDTELRGLFLEDEFVRAGAVLSARNRGDLEQAITLIQSVLERAAKEEQPRNEQDNLTREAIYSIHELLKEKFPK